MIFPDRLELKKEYDSRAGARLLITRDLIATLETDLSGLPSRSTVSGRPKDFDSWYKKYLKILKTEETTKPVITDLIGLRVICPFLEDLGFVEDALREHYTVREIDKKGAHFSFKEFGYESVHLLIDIPEDILAKRGNAGCTIAEVQIRTILQDAWAEVEHELVYKAEFTPFDEPMKRKLAAVNASLSLADIIFQEIRNYQRQLNDELGKRRSSFYRKIGEETDALLFEDKIDDSEYKPPTNGKNTIDELLLNALYAHNKNQFAEAIGFYSRILDLNPDNSITSLIYKHRGMANFAQSSYNEAIEDFTRSLEFDTSSYKAAYYRGVVKSVLRNYSGSIEDFSLSLTINPYHSFALHRRAQAYYHLGDYPAALGDCESSLALAPDFDQAAKLRDLLREKLKMLG
jgi:putative GTP pyrophosphokinase